MNVSRTECSECFVAVKVNLDAGTITVRVPSSAARGGAKRGKDFVAAHVVTAEGAFDGHGLLLWECPVCGYADSTYVDPETRKALA